MILKKSLRFGFITKKFFPFNFLLRTSTKIFTTLEKKPVLSKLGHTFVRGCLIFGWVTFHVNIMRFTHLDLAKIKNISPKAIKLQSWSWYFETLIFDQSFLSPKVKQSVIISNKHGNYNLSHELSNADVKNCQYLHFHMKIILVLAVTQCPVGKLIFRDHSYINYSRGSGMQQIIFHSSTISYAEFQNNVREILNNVCF